MGEAKGFAKISDERKKLWKNYYDSGESREARDSLVEEYRPIAAGMAKKMYNKAPPWASFPDLFAEGMMGLVKGIPDYDPQEGTRPGSYLFTRVRGSIIDSIRALDWVTRSARKMEAEHRKAQERSYIKFGEFPSEEETAKEMGIPMSEYEEIRKKLPYAAFFSIEDNLRKDPQGNRNKRGEVVINPKAKDPARIIEALDLGRRCFESLTPEDRFVADSYYRHGLDMEEIGGILGVSGSRVSQIHARMIKRLRNSSLLAKLL
jgi:RNA polymerase sigma factor FliA